MLVSAVVSRFVGDRAQGHARYAQVGKIAIFDFQAYVAVERVVAMQALKCLSEGKIKGRSLRIRTL